jgi:hypothetical protein
MANTQSMCTSFLGELFTATHNFGTAPTRGTSGADTFKAALYLASATINAATTVYTSTGEVTSTNYSAGGVAITNANAPAASNASATAGVGYWTPSASIVYGSAGSPVTFASFDCVLVYNSSQSNKAVSVHTFTAQTVTSGTFTLTMPSNTTTTALLRLATT